MKLFAKLAALGLVAASTYGSSTLAADAAAPSGEKHSLRYRFEVGEVLHYVIADQSSMDVQVGEVAQTVKHNTEAGRQFRVASVDGKGAADLELSVEYIKMSADSDDVHVGWDSRSGEPPPGDFAGVRDTIGRPLCTAHVLADGTVTGVNALNAAGATDVANLELLPRLPAEPMPIGGTWTENFTVEVAASAGLKGAGGAAPKKAVNLQRLYTLKKVENGSATIEFRTIVLSPIRDPIEEGQLVSRTPSGSFVFQIAAGRMTERVLTLNNQAIGFQGPQSMMRVVGQRTDHLASSKAQTAANPKASQN